METIQAMLSALWEVWKEMFNFFKGIAGRVAMFILWVICGLIILPCVFIAGNLYEPWTKWAEKM